MEIKSDNGDGKNLQGERTGKLLTLSISYIGASAVDANTILRGVPTILEGADNRPRLGQTY